MFLIITRDTMFFTAMKNILSKGNVVHIPVSYTHLTLPTKA